MAGSFPTEKIRNIVFLGHSGCGKTSLAEALLFNAGESNRLGRVEDGTTISDYDEEEMQRTMSLNLSVLPCVWEGYKINILDAPGYTDFQGEMLTGVHVADTVVLVVDGASGVEVGTQIAWHIAQENNKPMAVFINKMDRPNASYRKVIGQLREVFPEAIFVPMDLPIREGEEFKGIVDLVTLKTHTGTGQHEPAPDHMAAEIEEFRLQVVEYSAEGDDELMMKYFDGEELSEAEIDYGLRMGFRAGRVIPVYCGSATTNVATRSFLHSVVGAFPHPNARPVQATNLKTGETETLTVSEDGPLAAQVFKTVNDQYGRISYIRVWSGVLEADSRVYNTTAETEERMAGMATPRGKEHISINKATAGDIVVVVKLGHSGTGDTFSTKTHPLSVPPAVYPEPLYGLALTPQTQADSAKIGTALSRITEEDPTLVSRYEVATRETVLEGMGDIHLEVAIKRMTARFGLNVDTATPKIPMMETVGGTGSAQYRHKKQSGGAGQFGEVHLRVEPLERGAGFEFASEIFGGSISQPFLPSIEKGIKQVLEQGVIAGYPVVDVKAIVFDGKEHPVDSKDIAFQIAGREAFRLAMKEAGAILLEPIVDMKITVPEEFTGDVTSDLSTKRGRMSGMDQLSGYTVITAQAPLAEVQRYATELRSFTQGRGVYTMKVSHYERVPTHIANDIMAQAQQDQEE